MLSWQPPGVPKCSKLPSQPWMINESLRDPSENEQVPSPHGSTSLVQAGITTRMKGLCMVWRSSEILDDFRRRRVMKWKLGMGWSIPGGAARPPPHGMVWVGTGLSPPCTVRKGRGVQTLQTHPPACPKTFYSFLA